MQKQLASYLFQNKTCPLPGLGTLLVHGSGAEVDFTNKSIAAPKPFIDFVSDETDTTGLLDYLAASTQSSKNEVTESLEYFCDNLKKEIADQSKVKLEHIGDFFLDRSGKIGFKQEELPGSFLQPVYAERVIHPDAEHQILVGDKETTNTRMTELLSPKSAIIDRWWIWAIVLAAIGLLLLLIYFTGSNATAAFGNATKI